VWLWGVVLIISSNGVILQTTIFSHPFSRDIALAERDKAVAAEAEMAKRYHELNDE